MKPWCPTNTDFASVAQILLASILALFTISYYTPLAPKFLFHAGVTLPGLIWLAWCPRQLPKFIMVFGWVLFPLLALQLLNYIEIREIKVWLYLVALLASCTIVDRSRYGLKGVFIVFATASAIALIYATVTWLSIWYTTGTWVRLDNFPGRNADPIDSGLLIGSSLIFCWVFLVEPRLQRYSRAYFFIGLLGLSVLLLLASLVFQARSLLVGYGLFLLVYALRQRLWLQLSMVMVCLGLLGWLVGADQVLSQRGLSYRPEIWADALHRVSQQCGLVFGCGKDGYHFLGLYTHTHNLPLQVLYEDGLIGCLLFMIFAGYFIARGRLSNWFLVAVFGFGGQLTNTGWLLSNPKAYWIYFWLPAAMILIETRRDALVCYLAARKSNP